MATKLEIVNAGLARAGIAALASLSVNKAEADFINRVWQSEVESLLSEHPWRFARRFTALSRLEAASANRSLPQYQLPTNHIRTVGVTVDDVQETSIEQTEDKLLVPSAGESSTVVLEYVISDVAETKFPAHFHKVLSYRLGAAAALSLRRDGDLADRIEQRIEAVHLPRARTSDSQQGTTQNLRRSKLISAHRGARR